MTKLLTDVAKEVIDVLVETGKHEIMLLTRKINVGLLGHSRIRLKATNVGRLPEKLEVA